MDVETVDRQYAALQQQAQQTGALIQALAGKLAAAAAAGDANAREWQLDVREIALAVRDEEGAASSVLQAIHALVDNHVQSAAVPEPQYQQEYQQPAFPQYQQPAYQQPQYQQPAYAQQPQYQQTGGTLQRFLGGSFGQSIVRGAGFGIGDDIVNNIFDRL